MEKVSGCTGAISFFTVFFLSVMVLVLRRSQPPSFSGWAAIAFGGVLFLYFIRTLFVPQWVYDQRGFETRDGILGKTRKAYGWNSVIKILSMSDPGQFVPWRTYHVVIDDNYLLIISWVTTRDYLRVLTDVVHYVQKNNPNAEIDLRVLKRLENLDN